MEQGSPYGGRGTSCGGGARAGKGENVSGGSQGTGEGGRGRGGKQEWKGSGGGEDETYQQPPFPVEGERVRSDMARVGVLRELGRPGESPSSEWGAG